MGETVITVENLSKRYFISHGGRSRASDGLRHAMQDFATAPWRAGRRFLSRIKVRPQTSEGDSHGKLDLAPQSEEEFWALRDVSFQVKQGEVVGVIGRNGAGKSTLLKILGRIVEPTRGRVGIKGRVASLLEVGTGFHPELTGRENIFLNGAILGMSRMEVKSKFDDIVEFAEIEKFLDTPVKRYSSGMYVRLAFAVAAHLEAEILIVDEVLAVGDTNFQRKSMGKMTEVGRSGRTILFVSHNMAAVRSLCHSAFLLDAGKISIFSDAATAVDLYEADANRSAAHRSWSDSTAPGGLRVRLLSVRAKNESDTETERSFRRSEAVSINIAFRILGNPMRLNPHIHVFSHDGQLIFISTNLHQRDFKEIVEEGSYEATCLIPGGLLNCGQHTVSVYLIKDLNDWQAYAEKAISFEIVDDDTGRGDYFGTWAGLIRPSLHWTVSPIKSPE